MKEIREIDEHYRDIAEKLIRTDDTLVDIRNSQVVIVYLSSNNPKMHKGKLVLGQCEKVQSKYRWSIDADFTITLFEPNIEGLSEEIIERVIYHELLHVGVDYDKLGNELYSVNPHDYEDFKECIDRWGTDWARSQRGKNP